MRTFPFDRSNNLISNCEKPDAVSIEQCNNGAVALPRVGLQFSIEWLVAIEGFCGS
jgi:hypothetical protein